MPASADVGAPSWWNGDCDANHWNPQAAALGWQGTGAHRLGASYLGVPVCGPRRSVDGAPDVLWTRPGWGEFEWECVELTMRFMVQVYGVNPYSANGNTVVRNYTPAAGGGLVKVDNATVGVAPQPGDIMSFDNTSSAFGHAAVVVSTAVDGNGNGTVKLLSQNDTSDGWRTLSVNGWRVGGFGSYTPYGWLHDPLGRGNPSQPQAPTDGTFVDYHGTVYRIAGGAPILVHDWSVFGGPRPTVVITDAQWQALRTTPSDNTFIASEQTWQIYRVAGGAAFAVNDCAALGGCPGAINVDGWSIDHLDHLNAAPVSGTIVGASPSSKYWVFWGGCRIPASSGTSAVDLNDAAVAARPLCSPPQVSIGNASVAEGTGSTTTMMFPVTLSAASDQTVTVGYATSDGTAKAGSDYGAASGIVSFAPGQTSTSIGVTIGGDSLYEFNETFTVSLANPTNASIATGTAIGTITNDDPKPAVSVSDVTKLEGDSGLTTFRFTVSLSAPSGAPVKVVWATADGTAVSPSDYVGTFGNVVLPAGVVSKFVMVYVRGDTVVEPRETFFFNIVHVTGATIADGQGVGTIRNDD
jgi:hypothetical protein